MWTLLATALLIVSADPAVNTARHPDTVQVYPPAGQPAWPDRNFDRFPDSWSRRRGPNYPHYLRIELDDPSTPGDDKYSALRVDLNGGAATVYSPPIEVGPEFSYVLECQVRTSKLVHDEAYVTVTFYDAQHKALGVFTSERVHEQPAWTKLRVGPVAPPSGEAAFAIIGLHVTPTTQFDIVGSAWFADVWFAHLPRMNVLTRDRRTIFDAAEPIELKCQVSGILERDPLITFELIDISQKGIDRSSQRLDGEIVERKSSRLSRSADVIRHQAKGYAGEVTWSPTRVQPGFYRARVTMLSSQPGQKGTMMQQRELTFAVVHAERQRPGGEFGWSLPNAEGPITLPALADVARHAGINWVKIPVWHSHADAERGKQLFRFAEKLHLNGINVVGVLDKPPPEVRAQYGQTGQMYAADIFTADPELWYRSLEPVMTRLAAKIGWWQLGLDNDTSFVGYPNLGSKIADVKRQLERYGQQAHLGVGWRWTSELPTSDVPWSFVPLSAEPALTPAEMTAYVGGSRGSNVRRWVVVDPLSSNEFPLEVRAVDLVQRMLAAKTQGAEGIFVSNPFHPERGLLHEDGAPGELFLTWRTTALALANAKYLGQVDLPGDSQNHLFAHGQEAVLVVWNDRPAKETLYLGKNPVQVDLWGRSRKLEREGHEQTFEAGPLPTFIHGVHEAAIRMQMSFTFNETKLPSIFGKPYRTSFRFTNTFAQGIGGTVTLQFPKEWRKSIPAMPFKLAAGEEFVREFDFPMSFDASNGRHPIHVEFDVQADERYQFSVTRPVEIGLGDIEIAITTQLTPEGILVVRQEMTNNTDQVVDFKCYLSTPSERRRRNQVYRLGRGKDVKLYRYPNGKQLLGESFWLKAEEVEGQRVLNYRFTATE